MNIKRDVLRCSDLGKSAYLITKGMRLIEAEQFENKVYFAFENYDRCKSHLSAIEQNEPVGIFDFLTAFAQVKTALRKAREVHNG